MHSQSHVEFVTKVTNDVFAKHFFGSGKISKNWRKKYNICKICQTSARVFTKQLEWICNRVDNCTKNWQFVQNRWVKILYSQLLAKNVAIYDFFMGRIEKKIGNLTGEKYLTIPLCISGVWYFTFSVTTSSEDTTVLL